MENAEFVVTRLMEKKKMKREENTRSELFQSNDFQFC